MEQMRRIAHATVLRACLFGSLAIFCIMVGMSFDPRLAFQTGGLLMTAMALILVLKAICAHRKDHRRTEMWLYLEPDQRPPASCAQWVSATVLRETYLDFALRTMAIAVAMWAVALVFGIAR